MTNGVMHIVEMFLEGDFPHFFTAFFYNRGHPSFEMKTLDWSVETS